MSLATRCTACGTVFRVVQDQLKVSEGWVRCGRCQEVFNALDSLFDLDRDAPPAWPATPRVETPVEPADETPTTAADAPATAGLETRPLLRAADSESAGDFADARFPSELMADTQVQPTQAQPSEPADPTPLFVREAHRAAQWRRPRVRASLAVLALLLALVLVTQAGLHFRDELAARWPGSRPFLQAACAIAGCSIEAPRRVDQLSVESSGLVRLEGSGMYRFDVVLRNRGSLDVMLPAIELTLTDPGGQLVSRKVVTAAQLGARQTALAGGAEVALQGLLSTGDRRITGYTIEIFYP